jgi:digeranylgeranylglycerophospholipid reductase
MPMEDVVIVGAGLAGLACAQSAARRGLRVMLLERKAAVGTHVQTTGVLVKEAAEDWDIPARLTRKIHGVRLYSPSLAWVDLEAPGYYFLATDTPALLRWFAREAQRCGAVLIHGREFSGAVRDGGVIALADSGLRARFLVGADGPRSSVARHFGLGTNRAFLSGIEVELQDVRGVEQDREPAQPPLRLGAEHAGAAPGRTPGLLPRARHAAQRELEQLRKDTLAEAAMSGWIPGRCAPE